VGGAANYLWVNGVPAFLDREPTIEAPVAREVTPARTRTAVGAEG